MLFFQEKADYIAYYGGLMRDSIAQQVKDHGQTKAKGKDGVFLPSCLSHGMSTETTIALPAFDHNTSKTTNSTRVGFMELLGDWYFERNQLPSHILIDDCKMTNGQPCNPNCPNS